MYFHSNLEYKKARFVYTPPHPELEARPCGISHVHARYTPFRINLLKPTSYVMHRQV